MRIFNLFFLVFALSYSLNAQNNILSTNPLAEQILLGNYDAADYLPSQIINLPSDIVQGINQELSPDSLKAYIIRLSEFKNRNTGADTTSLTEGMGAARRWVYSKFQEFSAARENRLIPSYLQFDQTVCNMTQHRNVFAVLPGTNTADPSMILIEGHLDSRCDQVCDIDCLAEGVEDNASGTALVIELARVMSKYTFERTIVFMTTTGEEQGLVGANAFAQYTQDKNLNVKAVLNNDVVGGIICGETSSPPSCPGLNDIDSTQVRLFSAGSSNSPHKSLARYSKLQYQEELLQYVSVPMQVTIMSFEDRLGRGGDHIPFSDRGLPAIRYTSANEHGDAGIDPDYHDRQHTSDDLLGVDTDGDQIIDSFFVDFNYLARNAVINGITAGLIGNNPPTPDFTLTTSSGLIKVEIDDPLNYNHYRIGLRSLQNDFDSLYTIIDTNRMNIVPPQRGQYFVSVAAVDEHGIESCFSREDFVNVFIVGTEEIIEKQALPVQLLQNRPNPFDESTYILFQVTGSIDYNEAYIRVVDMSGKEVRRIEVELREGMNKVLFDHGYGTMGTYVYSLEIDGKLIASRRMVFAN